MTLEQEPRIQFLNPILHETPVPSREQALGIDIIPLEGDRRKLEMTVGPMRVEVLEIPALSLSQLEWDRIQAARESYFAMWGGNSHKAEIQEDPFDGRDEGSPYTTLHYLATVEMDGEEAAKTITMRKVEVLPEYKGTATEPDDIVVWNVHNNHTRAVQPLSKAIKFIHATEHGSSEGIRIAAISRTGTFPYDAAEKEEKQRERTAVAFAAIQVLAADGDNPDYFSCMQCPEFPDRVLSIKDKEGSVVKLDFAHTEDTLGLPRDENDMISFSTILNNNDEKVRTLKFKFPGYWFDNEKASKVIFDLMCSGQLHAGSLLKVHARMYADKIKPVTQEFLDKVQPLLTQEPEHRYSPQQFKLLKRFIDEMTSSRMFKHAIDIINTEGDVNAGLSGEEFRQYLIQNAGDGPYSSLLHPEKWRDSALHLLEKAKEKYESDVQSPDVA